MDKKLLKVEDLTIVAKDYNGKLKGKVDAVEGMSLTHNDFTDEYIQKINDLEVQLADVLGFATLMEELV